MNRTCSILLAAVLATFVLTGSGLGTEVMVEASDGKSPATTSIQSALDACARGGGGTVRIPAGRYLCGAITFRSGVRLHLEAGAVLLASRDPKDYEATGVNGVRVMLRGEGLKDVAITGKGVIDGQAEHGWRIEDRPDDFILTETAIARKAGVELKRAFIKGANVNLVAFIRCENVRVEGVSVVNSPFWGVHLAACRKVSVENLKIVSSLTAGVNSDGLDIDGCRDVHVTGCKIATGDDGICLKSTRAGSGSASCEDVLVEKCKVTSTSCALKIGTESFGDFRRIVFRDCEITDSNRGLGIFVRDGATVSDVLFSKIRIECNRKAYKWWGDGDALRFVVLKRNPDSRVGRIENVRLEDVSARGQGTSLIAGFGADGEIQGITLCRVAITLEAERTLDKRATDALVIRDACRVELEQVSLEWDDSKGAEPKWSSGLRAVRVKGLSQRDNRIFAAPGRDVSPIVLSENVEYR